MYVLKETKSSITAHNVIKCMLTLMECGPLPRKDHEDLIAIIKQEIAMIYVPCTNMLRGDTMRCGTCGGGNCCDWDVKLINGLPHVYVYVEERDEDWDY